MNCTTASSEQSLQIVSSLSLSLSLLCFTHLVRVATGDVVAFVLAVMLLLCFGTDDAAAANDDDNNNDDQGLLLKQSM